MDTQSLHLHTYERLCQAIKTSLLRVRFLSGPAAVARTDVLAGTHAARAELIYNNQTILIDPALHSLYIACIAQTGTIPFQVVA